MGIPLDKAEIIALFLESVLYGVFCCTFAACLYILLCIRRSGKVNIPMVITAILLFILATMHISIDLQRMLDAFYTHRDAPGGPAAYFGHVSAITHVLKSAVYITQTVVSDMLVVYRCHAVVRNLYFTTFLLLTVVGSAVSGYGSIYTLIHMSDFRGSIFDTELAPWITSFNIITAGTNIIATALISWTIWSINRPVRHFTTSNSLSPAILVVVESGAIYAFTLLLLTSFYVTSNNAQFIVLDTVSPIIGIVFCLIIIQITVRAGANSSSRSNTTWPWNSPRAHGVQSRLPGAIQSEFNAQPIMLERITFGVDSQPEVQSADKNKNVAVSIVSVASTGN